MLLLMMRTHLIDHQINIIKETTSILKTKWNLDN